jgi:hypothetical protein
MEDDGGTGPRRKEKALYDLEGIINKIIVCVVVMYAI